MDLRDRIILAMREQELLQPDVAKLIGVSVRTLSRFENRKGVIRLPSLRLLLARLNVEATEAEIREASRRTRSPNRAKKPPTPPAKGRIQHGTIDLADVLEWIEVASVEDVQAVQSRLRSRRERMQAGEENAGISRGVR